MPPGKRNFIYVAYLTLRSRLRKRLLKQIHGDKVRHHYTCPKHGSYSIWIEPDANPEDYPHPCPVCEYEKEQENARRSEICVRMRRVADTVNSIFYECGVGKTELKTFEDFEPNTESQSMALDICKGFADSFCTRLFEKHFKSIAPDCVKVEVTPCHGGNGFLIPISSDAYRAASRAMAEVYGVEPVPSRGGGSIPILADLQRILGIDPLLMGFGLERDTIHSPNESYLLSQLYAGMESIALFYRYYGEGKSR